MMDAVGEGGGALCDAVSEGRGALLRVVVWVKFTAGKGRDALLRVAP